MRENEPPAKPFRAGFLASPPIARKHPVRAGIYARVSTHDQQTLPLHRLPFAIMSAGPGEFELLYCRYPGELPGALQEPNSCDPETLPHFCRVKTALE
jgi:hypothetical protein